MAAGLLGASHGAATPPTTKAVNRITPASASGCRRARFGIAEREAINIEKNTATVPRESGLIETWDMEGDGFARGYFCV